MPSDCTKFGVDSSSRFPERRKTDATERPTDAGGYAGVGKTKYTKSKPTDKIISVGTDHVSAHHCRQLWYT